MYPDQSGTSEECLVCSKTFENNRNTQVTHSVEHFHHFLHMVAGLRTERQTSQRDTPAQGSSTSNLQSMQLTPEKPTCVKASKPVLAVTAGGTDKQSWGSTIATDGNINELRMLALTRCSGDDNTPFLVTSAPVPVDATKMWGRITTG